MGYKEFLIRCIILNWPSPGDGWKKTPDGIQWNSKWFMLANYLGYLLQKEAELDIPDGGID